eukprot:TRINITY_DN54268_c0_g1_i1.p1 TRINITY_DN54268_c0_g1~~TRINITY_DN54268_c0_g1_i1.p1  ORF type:complete len:712 (-),score=54.37 TRINITY_DN54268_c0_g1_i1:76-2211(-)
MGGVCSKKTAVVSATSVEGSAPPSNSAPPHNFVTQDDKNNRHNGKSDTKVTKVSESNTTSATPNHTVHVPGSTGSGQSKHTAPGEDPLPAPLEEGLSTLPILIRRLQLRGKTVTICCITSADATNLTFGLRDDSTRDHNNREGSVYSKEYASRELATHREFKNVRWSTFFSALNTVFGAFSTASVSLKRNGPDFILVIPLGERGAGFTIAMQKSNEPQKQFARLFLDPLMSFYTSTRHPDKAAEEAIFCKQTQQCHQLMYNIGNTREEIKKVEASIQPLQNEMQQWQKRLQEATVNVTQLSSDISFLAGGCQPPDLYPTGPHRFSLHVPYAKRYDPTVIPPNKVAMAQLRLQGAKDNKLGLCIPTEPIEGELRALLEHAPDSTHSRLVHCMNEIDKWDFDIFALNRDTNGGCLFITLYTLIHKYQLIHHFNLDEQILVNTLQAIEMGYHPNPYHNAVHAADVLQAVHYMLGPGGMIKRLNLSNEDILASLFSAAIHDFDHPGFNNMFHVQTHSYLATLYNDRAVLENHHCASVFSLMQQKQYNLFEPLSEEMRKDIRDTVVEMVISTDMGQHGVIFENFKRKLHPQHHDEPACDWTKRDDVRLALSIAIKMADISNCARPKKLYRQWAERVSNEFYNQGDVERKLNLKVSPFMDRNKHQSDYIPGQINFMNFIVIPLFEAGACLLPTLQSAADQIVANRDEWSAEIASSTT